MANESFERSIIGIKNDELHAVVRSRYVEQFSQLGIPSIWRKLDKNKLLNSTELEFVLYKLKDSINNNSIFLMALAENAQGNGQFVQAIRYWQAMVSDLETDMPQAYYDRLGQAYSDLGSFPLASEDEEMLCGSDDKHEILKKLHEVIKPDFYLEIGVQSGKSLNIATCKALGIDPMPKPNMVLKESAEVLRLTSDEFFASQALFRLKIAADLVFIDGMHLFEYALRDFMNVEKYSKSTTVVVIDDIFPGHPAQAKRDRSTRAWTGDVWKLLAILEKYRKDLKISKLNIYPTGLMVVENLDKNNGVLTDNYEQIVEEYMNVDIDFDKYIERKEVMEASAFLENFTNKRNTNQ